MLGVSYEIIQEMNSFRDLKVWQKAVRLAIEIYTLTEKFPREEIYGLTSQMRRSAVSIASNIAEGRNRGTRKEFSQFLRISLGSCAELSTQIDIAKRLSKIKMNDFSNVESLLTEIMKMVYTMVNKLSS